MSKGTKTKAKNFLFATVVIALFIALATLFVKFIEDLVNSKNSYWVHLTVFLCVLGVFILVVLLYWLFNRNRNQNLFRSLAEDFACGKTLKLKKPKKPKLRNMKANNLVFGHNSIVMSSEDDFDNSDKVMLLRNKKDKKRSLANDARYRYDVNDSKSGKQKNMGLEQSKFVIGDLDCHSIMDNEITTNEYVDTELVLQEREKKILKL